MRSIGLAAAAAVVLVFGATVIAGCGGSDDTSSTATAAISKEDFLTQGNQICADGNKTLDAAGQEFGSGKPSQADLEQYVSETMVPTIQGEIDGIEALGAPEGDEEQVTAITDAAQSALDQAADDPTVLTSGEDPFAQANDLANAYGLTECGG